MPALQHILTSLSYFSAVLQPPFSATNTRLPHMGETSPAVHMETLPLFGHSLGWNRSGSEGVTWVSVDDRVRGGSSVSHFHLIEPTEDGSTDGKHADARFWGTLDTKTLGGAGFSSVTTDYANDETSLDLKSYDGIVLDVVRADDKKYTFILKDEVPGHRDDGRRKSGISFEYSFSVSSGTSEEESTHQIYVPWDALSPTHRGREIDHPGIRRDQIRKFSIMMRSFFEQQAGDFELVLRSISAYRKVAPEHTLGKI